MKVFLNCLAPVPSVVEVGLRSGEKTKFEGGRPFLWPIHESLDHFIKMHSINKHTTAILVFALSSREELKRKKINDGGKLFTALSQHTLKTVQKTGLPYFYITEKEQRGSTFGDRFTHAVKFVYNKGFEQVITIGNDSPQLKASHILKANRFLSKNKMILGPSSDGGFYLMGLHRDNFDARTFRILPWQTSKLRNCLIAEWVTPETDLLQLNVLIDVDTVQDIKTLSKFTKQLALNILRIVRSLIQDRTEVFEVHRPHMGLFRSNSNHNRGSPTLISI